MAGLSVRDVTCLIKILARLGSYLEAVGEDTLLVSFKSLAEFSSLKFQD